MPSIEIAGQVVAWYQRAGAAAVKLSAPLRLGDEIYIRGATTDLSHRVTSLQIDHTSVSSALAGQVVGITLPSRCRKRDVVYRINA